MQRLPEIRFIKRDPEAIAPYQGRTTDAGFDLFSNETLVLNPFGSLGNTKTISTGISFDIPAQWVGDVRPRSGITSQGILFVQYGTVDEGYTGEVKIIVTNLSSDPVVVKKGLKLAQIVFHPRPWVDMIEVEAIPTKDRGDNGFGSSGDE